MFGHVSRRRLSAVSLSSAGLTLSGAKVAFSNPVSTDDNLMVVDVRKFGARGDGIADDSKAINKAIEVVRSQHTKIDRYPVGARLVFPTGTYRVASSINLTILQNINTVVDGFGSVIVGECVDSPVIDALGSRWLTVRDLSIVGSLSHLPSIGLQIGRLSHVVADDHYFSNLKIVGSFATACLYNRGAETTGFVHVLCWNDVPDGYCLIQDGVNHFDVQSKFVKTLLMSNEDTSFDENVFINCDFRHQGGGIPVWLGDTSRHEFIRCYAATKGRSAFVLFSGGNGHVMLDIDCHCEETGLNSVFELQSTSEKIIIRGFSYKENGCFASDFVFSSSGRVREVSLQNARVEIASHYEIGCRTFSSNCKWSMAGYYYCGTAHAWNGQGHFEGILTIGDNFVVVSRVGGGRGP